MEVTEQLHSLHSLRWYLQEYCKFLCVVISAVLCHQTDVPVLCYLSICKNCKSCLMFGAIIKPLCYHPSKIPATSLQCLPFVGEREVEEGQRERSGLSALDLMAELGYS